MGFNSGFKGLIFNIQENYFLPLDYNKETQKCSDLRFVLDVNGHNCRQLSLVYHILETVESSFQLLVSVIAKFYMQRKLKKLCHLFPYLNIFELLDSSSYFAYHQV
jgi:predicted nucleotidyltransferase